MDLEQSALDEEEDPSLPKKKAVQFHQRDSIAEVQRISRISMYNPDEVTAYWGDSEEHRLRKQELKEAVMDWHKGRRNSDNLTFTTVGIEDKVGEGRAIRKEMRWRSRNVVMDQQAWQDEEGYQDDELLADIYKVTTQNARLKAREVAQRIADDVARFQDHDQSSAVNTTNED